MSAKIDGWAKRHLRGEKGVWKPDADWILLLALDERSIKVRLLDRAVFEEYCLLTKLTIMYLRDHNSVFVRDFWKRIKSDLDEMMRGLKNKKLGYSYFSPASRFDEMSERVEGLLNVVWYRISPEAQSQKGQKQLPPPR